MPAPASVLIVTNISQNPLWVAGVQIAALGNETYDAGHIAGVCSDMNFWAAYLAGYLSLNLNGVGVPGSTPAVVAFLVAVALGDISP